MAARFWVTQPVSGAIVSVASAPQIRLTVSSTTGMTTGDVRTVFGVGGTTEANGTWTITVIDATHIDLQGTTFTNVYTSGGSVNGKWDATNTNNWVTTSGGTNYGQTVPGSSDTATFDGSSGGGTVTPNTTINIQSLTTGAFTGTLDFSANNNNVTLSTSTGFAGSGAGTRTINLGNGTWTLSSTGAAWDFTTTTGLTFNANSSTISFSAGTPGARTFTPGGKTFNTVTVATHSTGQTFTISGTGATIATLTVGQGNVLFPAGGTTTVTNLNVNGTAAAPAALQSSSNSSAATVAVTTVSIAYAAIKFLTFTGSPAAQASFDLGGNTGITITPAGKVIGG